MSSVAAYIADRSALVDLALDQWLPRANTRPASLHKAMRYSVFAGGKRLRPVLCLAAAEACGGSIKAALPAACALECVHTYSLIHDDLPCMDDDDLRRGKPTSHKVFGEAVAVLAGDALLAMAFEILCKSPRPLLPALVNELARAAGSRALVAGQTADLEAEGRLLGKRDVLFIHEGKTAAMIAAATRMGAITADGSVKKQATLGAFGRGLGLAFQIVDDILDATQTTSQLGKSAGKDARDAKSTFPAAVGMDAARAEARRLTRAAQRALDPLGSKASVLRQLADHLLSREF
jgi:geranylgeranyl diphosphate synthase type II